MFSVILDCFEYVKVKNHRDIAMDNTYKRMIVNISDLTGDKKPRKWIQ